MEPVTARPAPAVSLAGRGYSKRELFWWLQALGWSAFGVLMFVWGLDYWRPIDAFINKLLMVGLGFAITMAFRAVFRRMRAASVPHFVTALVVAVLAFAGAAVWIEIGFALFQACLSLAYIGQLQVHPSKIPVGTLLYQGFVLLTWSLLYFGINAVLELEQEKRRASAAEALAHQARLEALRSQLEPHFLFNTLNAISTLVVEGENAQAAKMIARLSDFLRLTLETVERPEISVAEELEFVRRYLEIEQVRFGDRLRVTIEAAPEVMSNRVPALLLQPLVENAALHGVESGAAQVEVHLAATRAGDDGVRIAIENTVAPEARMPAPAESPGIGLRNTWNRLTTHYGAHFDLHWERPSADRVRLVLDLPAAPLAAGA